MPRSRDSGLVLALAGLAFIAAETLVPRPGDRALVELTGLSCLICGSLGGVDVALNVILFIPLGLGLGLLKISRRRALVFVVATTITIEILQLGVIAGRDSSLSDLLTNTLGGMFGFWLARRRSRILFPDPALSARLALSAAVAWVAVQAVTAWAVQPAPPPPVYYGQWAARLGHMDVFGGTLFDATINGAPMPKGAYRNSGTVLHAIEEGAIAAEARVTPGKSTTGFAPIMSIFNDRQQEVLFLGRNRDDVIFRLSAHASDLRIRGPALRLPDGFTGLGEDTVTVLGSYQDGHLTAGITGHATRTVSVSPSWGWSMLMPWEYAFGSSIRFLTGLWIGGLLLPVGWWAGQARNASPGVRLACVIATPLAGLGVVPLLAGLPPVHATEWVAALFGLGTGLLLAGWLRRPVE